MIWQIEADYVFLMFVQEENNYGVATGPLHECKQSFVQNNPSDDHM